MWCHALPTHANSICSWRHLSDPDKLTVVRHHAGVSDGHSFTLVINTIGTWRVAKGAEIISGYFRLSRQLHELCMTRLLGDDILKLTRSVVLPIGTSAVMSAEGCGAQKKKAF